MLDEPTNHLDIPARQVLEQALQDYEGAALIVSHDRYFISQVANRVVELRDGGLVLYRGDYAYYREKKGRRAAGSRGCRTGQGGAGEGGAEESEVPGQSRCPQGQPQARLRIRRGVLLL